MHVKCVTNLNEERKTRSLNLSRIPTLQVNKTTRFVSAIVHRASFTSIVCDHHKQQTRR